MRITHEADYALRIVYVLAKNNKQMSAKLISEEAGITQRIALKILRRLGECNIVCATKGAAGGYSLCKSTDELSIGEIIETIDGPLNLNHCLSPEFVCTRVECKSDCPFHTFICETSLELRRRFYSAKISNFIK